MGYVAAFGTVMAGIGFYWLRCRHQFWYGMIEILVAVSAIVVTWFPPFAYLLVADPYFLGGPTTRAVGIFSGIYVLVRGMDNIDRGLPQVFRNKWDRLFPKR